MAPPIPIENLYYLFCYAWGHFEEGHELAVDAIKCPNLLDLLGKVLVNGIRRLRRRGFDRGYVPFEEEIRGVRGRIAFGPSLKRSLFNHGKACCVFDELGHDIPHNRIIRATLVSLLRAEGLDANVRKEVQSIERELNGIALVRIQKRDFSRIQLHRNNIFYNLILNICELIYDQLIPTEKPGKSRFADILRDEVRMSALFEDFVRNFYKAERALHNYDVRRENIDWAATNVTDFDSTYLPIMKTDICLNTSTRKIIVDTKFYTKTFDTQYEIPKIKSGDLYQIFSYLTNAKPNIPSGKIIEGILLYPTVNEDIELSYVLGGHRVRVATVDLSTDWQSIHKRLLGLIAEPQGVLATWPASVDARTIS